MPIYTYSPINIFIGLQTIASTRYYFVNILACFTDNSRPSNTPLYTYNSIHSVLLCIYTYLFYRHYLSTQYSFVYILTCFTDSSCPLSTPLYIYLPVLQTILVHPVLPTFFTDNTCPLSPLLSLQLLSVATTSKTDCMSACESDVNCYAIISYSNSHCLLMGKSKPSASNLEAHVAIRKCIKGKIHT